MSENDKKDFYDSMAPKIIRNISFIELPLRLVLSVEYSREEVKAIIKSVRAEFIALLPDLPYIGGEENPLTTNIIGTGWVLALYRILSKKGKSAKEVGEIVCAAIEKMLSFIPGFLLRWYGKKKYNSQFIMNLKALSSKSHERKYEYDFVFDVIEGDGLEFDLGIDYLECGICKFLCRQNASELSPYMCLVDYIVSSALGLGFRRTSTLANGGNLCDFRFKRI